MNARSLAVVTAAALAVAVALAVNAATHTRTTPTTAARRMASATASTADDPLVDADKVPDVSAADLATAKTFGWDITLEQPVDRLTAEDVASRRMAVGKMRAPIVGLSLARVTIHGYGDPKDSSKTDTDALTDADLNLRVENRLLWVAVARHAQMPVAGPSPAPDSKDTAPTTEHEDVILLVEPGKETPLTFRTLASDG